MKHTIEQLQQMSASELKVIAYDLFALAEQTQKNIQILNELIAIKSKQTLSELPEVDKKK